MKLLHRWPVWSSLRNRIATALLSLTLTLGVVALLQATVDLTRILEGQLRDRGIAIARDIAARSATPSQTNDVFALYQAVNDGILNSPDVRYVFLVEPSGDIRVHSFEEGVPPGLVDGNRWNPAELRTIRRLQTNEGPMVDIAMPVLSGQGGVIRIGMSVSGVRKQVISYIGHVFLLVGIAILAGGIVLSFALSSLLTRPLRHLADAARRVGNGDLTTKIPTDTADELGDLARAFNSMTNDLERKERGRNELLDKLINAQEEERRRIAREIHDEPTQELTGALLQLETVAQRLALGGDGKDIEQVRLRVRGAMESLHQIMTELRPQALDDLGFVPAVRWFAEQKLAERGVEVEFRVVGRTTRLPSHIEVAAFRIAQEAINNVAKHAQAANVRIQLKFSDSVIGGEIRDNGRGFDPRATSTRPLEGVGLGLQGMQERTVLLGGSFAVASAPGEGTRVSFEIPLAGVGAGHGERD